MDSMEEKMIKKVQGKLMKALAKLKAKRELRQQMENFCISNFTPMGHPGMRQFHRKVEAWAKRVHAMSDAELAKEFDERNGHEYLAMMRKAEQWPTCQSKC